jgi:predicted O-methyltransferase YrrM
MKYSIDLTAYRLRILLIIRMVFEMLEQLRKTLKQSQITPTRKIFQYLGDKHGGSQTLPSRKIEEVFPKFASSTITLFHPSLTPTGVRLIELILFAYLASSLEDVAFFEIGTSEGRTARNIALNLGSRGRLTTIDLPVKQPGMTEMPAFQREEILLANAAYLKALPPDVLGKLIFLSGDSTQFDYSEHLGKYDVVFVDGNHSSEAVLADANTARRLARLEGGLVFFHDYLPGSMPTVTETIDALSKENRIIRLEGTKLALWAIGSPRISADL